MGRPSVSADRLPLPLPELFASAVAVAGLAEAADVAVDVETTQGERLDMVGHDGLGHESTVAAVPAERLTL